MNRIAAALAVSLLIGPLLAPLRAGEIYVERIDACVLEKFGELDLGTIDVMEDPQGHVALAILAAQCGAELAEQWAAGEFLDPFGPDAGTTNKMIKQLGALGRRLDKLDGALGEARTKLARKAHLKAADPRLQAGDGRAFRIVNGQLHGALNERLAALEIDIIELVEQYDAQSTASGTEGEAKALKFVALANLLLQRARSLAAETSDKQGALVAAIDEGSAPADLAEQAKRCRAQMGECYDLLAGAQKAATKAQKSFAKELDRQRKDVPCELTDPEVPFQGGGTVTLSVDGGPVQVLERGTTGLSIFSSTRRYVQLGTKTGVYPRIVLLHEGRNFRGKGTYQVTRVPFDFDDPTPYAPTKAKGHYYSVPGSSGFYTTDSGSFTVTTFVLKAGKRRIAGSFDLMLSTDDGDSVHVTGTFDLCGFQIETRDGIE